MNNIDYNAIYEDIYKSLKRKKSIDIANVTKAYNFAKIKHEGQFRKSGEPYIIHPLAVAQILEKLDFNTDVIAAAILHDTVEDCGVSISEISNLFGKEIAKIVDAVTAITNENFKPDIEDIYADTSEFFKLAVEDKTYQKLISMGKENKFAFYIKFADRINNLQTISIFPKHKQIAKIEETEKWIIPLAELLKSKYFSEQLKNYCFKIRYKDENTNFFKLYNNYHARSKEITRNTVDFLSENINLMLHSIKAKYSLLEIKLEPKTELEVFNSICSKFSISQLSKVLESNFSKVPMFTLYLTFSGNPSKKNIYNVLFDVFDTQKVKNTISFTSTHLDKFNNEFIEIKNNQRQHFDFMVCTKHDYAITTIGTTEGTDIDIIDDTISGDIATDFITVKTRSGEPIRIQSGSTVLDFAFRIHKDIGFSCKYAIINNSPTKSPIYTKLRHGDKVEIICEKDENNLLKNIAVLRWLVYVTNETSQKLLIKYFEKKFDA